MWNVYNIRQSVYAIERLERAVSSVHIATDIVVCSTHNDIGQISKRTWQFSCAIKGWRVKISVCDIGLIESRWFNNE